ncbi:MAG: hypothetical protein GY834_14425 [Bacteroidetes bacterium]|nr:hypothetical protein [Bacteroidota bacterium]
MKQYLLFVLALMLMIPFSQAQEEGEITFTHKGYYNATNFGFLIGSTDNQNAAPFSFMMINGYGVTDQIALGIGIGAEFLSESYLPLVLDARYYFRTQKFSPYVFIQSGYSFPLDEETQEYYLMTYNPLWSGYGLLKPNGGWLLNPGVGIKAMFNDNLGMTFNIGYRLQRLSFNREEADVGRVMEIDMNRLEVKVGILFK